MLVVEQEWANTLPNMVHRELDIVQTPSAISIRAADSGNQ
jgi:hypothetical protein